MGEVRVKGNDLSREARPGWGRRLAGALLYPLFGLVLLIPYARRYWRRGPAAGEVARRLGAPHVIHGGTQRVLYASAEELLVAATARPERVERRYLLRELDQIQVDGEVYRPQYVSFAKEPPKRGDAADRQARSRLALRFGVETLELDYRGAFARQLAEAAAHTLHQLRQLSAADGVGGQAPEVFHIIRRQDVAE